MDIFKLPDNASRSRKSESRSRSDSPESIYSSPKILEPASSGGKRADEQSDSSFYLDASSEDEWKGKKKMDPHKITAKSPMMPFYDPEHLPVVNDFDHGKDESSSDDGWKPSFLKDGRKIDPGKIIDINSHKEPLFGPVQEIPVVSDFDDDEDDGDLSTSSVDDVKKVVAPSKEPDNKLEPIPTPSANTPPQKNTGVIKKRLPPNVKPINIGRNPDAVRLIRKLVEYFVFHNSLPKKDKEIQKQKISTELIAVFSQTLDDLGNNVFEQVLETMEAKNIKSDKKVKTKNVSCQTIITGDVLSHVLLPLTDGKISNLDVNNEKINSVKTDILEAIVDLFNEHIVKLSINNNPLS